MERPTPQSIHTLLGSNNLLLVVADGYRLREEGPNRHYLADLALTLAAELNCYAVVNGKYKKELINLADVAAILERPRIRESFLTPIRSFKDEITANGLLPLVIHLQPLAVEAAGQEMLLLGYGQGERGSVEAPHRPTLAPSLLAKIRVALDDCHLTTAVAPTDSPWCGNSTFHLNQLFRQKQALADWYDPEVRSFCIAVRHDLINQEETAAAIGRMLAPAFAPFAMAMSLVRNVDINSIDTEQSADMQYIFRLTGDSRYPDLFRESYIDELAESIDRNGLLHPLVLLKKDNGRYKILCGFRRYQALKRLGRPLVEAKVYQESDFSTSDFFNISLAENTKRRNLNPIEIGNFLESASASLGLSNQDLAAQFGATLGIGRPGSGVSHSTIHKYRKVNQIRLRGESPEMIADVINERLQFAVAAEMLAPIKNSRDRDSLYLQIIKPLTPTRPQLNRLRMLLARLAPSLHDAIALPRIQQAIAKAAASAQPAATLIRLLDTADKIRPTQKQQEYNRRIEALRKTYFGQRAGKRDFNITPEDANRPGEYIVQFRLKRGREKETMARLERALVAYGQEESAAGPASEPINALDNQQKG